MKATNWFPDHLSQSFRLAGLVLLNFMFPATAQTDKTFYYLAVTYVNQYAHVPPLDMPVVLGQPLGLVRTGWRKSYARKSDRYLGANKSRK